MERSKSNPLHNFDLPPGLTWGRQRFLRCMDINPIRSMQLDDDVEKPFDSDDSDDCDESNNNHLVKNLEKVAGGKSSEETRKSLRLKMNESSSKDKDVVSDDDGEISVTREKVVSEHRSEIGKMKETILEKECGGSRGQRVNAKVDNNVGYEKKTMRPRRNLEKKEERPRFRLILSRKEIEEDFIAMTGKKPPRKPMKRSKVVQAQINGIFPGSLLFEAHPDRYKVNDNKKV